MSNVVAAILLGNGVGGRMAIAPHCKTCRVSWQNKFVKLVHLVGFIVMKFVTMHGHTNVKSKYLQILTHSVKFEIHSKYRGTFVRQFAVREW